MRKIILFVFCLLSISTLSVAGIEEFLFNTTRDDVEKIENLFKRVYWQMYRVEAIAYPHRTNPTTDGNDWSQSFSSFHYPRIQCNDYIVYNIQELLADLEANLASCLDQITGEENKLYQ